MHKTLLALALAAFGLGSLAAPAARAANADNPYGNVDHTNDAGNNTGDSRIDSLNNGQLNRNYQGPLQLRTPSGSGSATTIQPGTVAPQAPQSPPPAR